MLWGSIIGLCWSAASAITPAVDDPLGLQKSPVYEVYGRYAVRGMDVHRSSIKRMLATGITALAQTEDFGQALRKFIREEDIVALNFQPVGGPELGTNTEVAGILLEMFYAEGFKPEQFMLVGLSVLPAEAQGTRPWRYGWQNTKTDFVSDQDYLAQWLDEVTAIINIPSILDDSLFGLRGALTNMTWPLLKSPARLYLNGGDPFIADIYDLPAIRGKVRLHIANGLRLLYYGGPVVKQRYVCERGTLLFAIDPVALDRVALEILERARTTMAMPDDAPQTTLEAPYLETAAALGLGYDNLNMIEYRYLKSDSR